MKYIFLHKDHENKSKNWFLGRWYNKNNKFDDEITK